MAAVAKKGTCGRKNGEMVLDELLQPALEAFASVVAEILVDRYLAHNTVKTKGSSKATVKTPRDSNRERIWMILIMDTIYCPGSILIFVVLGGFTFMTSPSSGKVISISNPLAGSTTIISASIAGLMSMDTLLGGSFSIPPR